MSGICPVTFINLEHLIDIDGLKEDMDCQTFIPFSSSYAKQGFFKHAPFWEQARVDHLPKHEVPFVSKVNELVKASKQGYKIFIAYIIQREDCKKFIISADIDPVYSKLLSKAVKKKLNVLCYDCKFSLKGIKLNKKIKYIGLRPGEKIHEEMISETDAINSMEFKNYYIIFPSFVKIKSKKKISNYSSFNNKFFLSTNLIKKLIKDNLYSFELEK